MITKEVIQKKITEHGERLKQINERGQTLRAQDVRIQQNLIQLSDEAKVVQGAVRELQDLLRELNEDTKDTTPENPEVLPSVDNSKSSGDAPPGGGPGPTPASA